MRTAQRRDPSDDALIVRAVSPGALTSLPADPHADRETTIGTMINAYLTKSAELDDHAVHLLFSANRWEKK